MSSIAGPVKSLVLRFSTLDTLSELTPPARLTVSLPPPMSMDSPAALLTRLTKSFPAVPMTCSTLARFSV